MTLVKVIGSPIRYHEYTCSLQPYDTLCYLGISHTLIVCYTCTDRSSSSALCWGHNHSIRSHKGWYWVAVATRSPCLAAPEAPTHWPCCPPSPVSCPDPKIIFKSEFNPNELAGNYRKKTIQSKWIGWKCFEQNSIQLDWIKIAPNYFNPNLDRN